MPDRGEQTETILDHIDGIKVPGDVFAEPANEYAALLHLWAGMEFLYGRARRCEEVAQQRLDLGENRRIDSMGLPPAVRAAINAPLLTCAFHWYSTTACQYVRTVGTIAHRNDKTRPHQREYLNAVIPEVLVYRNKVAAHFAWTMDASDNRDNEAERQMSVMPHLGLSDGRLCVVPMRLHIRKGTDDSDSGDLRSWTITGIHKLLRERYKGAQ